MICSRTPGLPVFLVLPLLHCVATDMTNRVKMRTKCTFGRLFTLLYWIDIQPSTLKVTYGLCTNRKRVLTI